MFGMPAGRKVRGPSTPSSPKAAFIGVGSLCADGVGVRVSSRLGSVPAAASSSLQVSPEPRDVRRSGHGQ
ncbi:hypothetical protein IAQ61_001493 [Plenodomus lingam]|uniref:uncharacterized protein n=1 Tax=Leptosphaeria maculans TaxID=5022 RepID=UPI0033210BDD|nr:hypothetical protein IAQ61_001493 [Plenodomus lingam]